MKQLAILFTLLTAISSSSLAQPILSLSDIGFQIGDTQLIDSIDFVDMSNMVGENMTWDLQDLEPYGTLINAEIVDPATLSTASSFPSSNSARTLYVPGFTIDQFFDSDASSMQLLGSTLNFGSTEYISIHTDPELAFLSPLTYGDNGTDTYAHELFGAPGETTNSGVIDWDVPGYGTLLVNGQTYSDVLMYRQIRSDTTVATFSGFTFETYLLSESYFFMKAGYHYPLVIFVENSTSEPGFPPTTTYEASVLLSQTTGLGSFGNIVSNIRVFPVPSKNGEITLEFNLSEQDDLNIELFDLSGRLIHKESSSELPGMIRKQVDFSGQVENGVYMLMIHSSKGKRAIRVAIGQ